MGRPIQIRMADLGPELRARVGTVRASLHVAAVEAAKRFRDKLVDLHDDADKVDTGQHRDSWRVQDTARGATVINDAPYAGVIERGARPHHLPQAAILKLARWAWHKLGVVDEKEALSMAYAIAAKIAKKGQAPTYIVRDALPIARRMLRREIQRELQRQAGQPVRGGYWARVWGQR